MKHFIIEIVYKAPLEKINELTASHREFLKQGYDRGYFLYSGPQVPRTGGIIAARGESIEQISEFLKEDPYRKNDAAEYRFIEFNPVRHQDLLNEWI